MLSLCGWFTPGNQHNDPASIDTVANGLAADTGKSYQTVTAGGFNFISNAFSTQVVNDSDLYVYASGTIRSAYTSSPESITVQELAQGYLSKGEHFLADLQGTFSVYLYDKRQNKLLLAIDPIGGQQLYYYENSHTLYFSNTLTALLTHPEVPKKIEPQRLFDFFYFHNIPSPNTIYQNIKKLGPGEFICVKGNQTQRQSYYRHDYREQSLSSPAELSEQCRQLIETSVSSESHENTGAFLSGGTDSSTVTAFLAKISDTPVKTFSIGFEAQGYDESEYARITAKRFGTDHHEYYVTKDDVLDCMPKIASTYSEPFGNASAVPTFYCAKLAKEAGVSRLLAGDGGDEIFAGNERYLKNKVFGYYQQIPKPLRLHALDPLLANQYVAKLPFLGKASSYVRQSNIPLPDRMETYNFINRTPVNDIFTPALISQIDIGAPLKQQQAIYNQAWADSDLNRMLALDMKFTLADNDLRKVTLMCELNDIDVRFPLLSQELMMFAARLPDELKIKGHKLRFFFKETMKDILATETITKSKHGFGLPFGLWLRDHPPLRDYTHDRLKSISQRGFIQPSYIEHIMTQHQQDDASYYGVMIWLLIVLEEWLDQHEPGFSL